MCVSLLHVAVRVVAAVIVVVLFLMILIVFFMVCVSSPDAAAAICVLEDLQVHACICSVLGMRSQLRCDPRLCFVYLDRTSLLTCACLMTCSCVYICLRLVFVNGPFRACCSVGSFWCLSLRHLWWHQVHGKDRRAQQAFLRIE